MENRGSHHKQLWSNASSTATYESKTDYSVTLLASLSI